jgi:hypothetical protein
LASIEIQVDFDEALATNRATGGRKVLTSSPPTQGNIKVELRETQKLPGSFRDEFGLPMEETELVERGS